jgi:hypothetical protein
LQHVALGAGTDPVFAQLAYLQPFVEDCTVYHASSYVVNSRLLANLLLEVDVINTKDIDREINKLAARIYDPRGQEWMRRVGRYFVINVDELMQPAAFYPEKPGIRGSKFYHHPEKGWTKEFRGEPAAARTHKIPDWYVLQNPEQENLFWSPKGWVELAKAKKFKHDETGTSTTPAEGVWMNFNVAANKFLPHDEVYFFQNPDDPQLFLDIKRPHDAKNQTWVGIENATPAKQPVDLPFPGTWIPSNELSKHLHGPQPFEQRDKFHLFRKMKFGDFEYWNKDKSTWNADRSQATEYSLKQARSGKIYHPEKPDYKHSVEIEPRFISTHINPETLSQAEESLARSARALTRRVLGEAEEDEPLITSLHMQPEQTTTGQGYAAKHIIKDPLWKRVQQQTYKPFDPKKAAAKSLYGEPPSKKQLEPWMTQGERQRYFFDPLTVYQQEIWGKLQDIADYFNYLHTLKQQASRAPEYVYQNPDDPARYWSDIARDWVPQYEADTFTAKQEMSMPGRWVNVWEQRAVEAEAVLKRLQQMRPNDINGFRRVFTDAQDFIRKVKEQPHHFIRDMTRMAVAGPLTLIRATRKESVQSLAKRNPEGCETGETSWCVKSTHYSTYAPYGPFYFVDKNAKPYALIQPGSGNAKAADDTTITGSMAKEIAPLFVKAGLTGQKLTPMSGQAEDGGYRALRAEIDRLQR